MKYFLHKIIVTVLLGMHTAVMAQSAPPPPPAGAPPGFALPGVVYLVIAAMGFGMFKISRKNKY
jgi:hypothetical protein